VTESHVVSALRAKRAEISGYVRDLEKKARIWRARLTHIDAAIKIFSPETDPEAIPPRRVYRRSRYFRPKEFGRLCLEELRKANGPVTTLDIVTRIVAARGLPADDPALIAAFNERTLGFLRAQRKRGIVIKTGISRNAKWALVAPDKAE
jgi:hypothetical protein